MGKAGIWASNLQMLIHSQGFLTFNTAFLKVNSKDTVDGRNPAPADMVNIPLCTGFYNPRWCRISSMNSSNLA